MARHVLVVDYDPTWPLKFRQEAQKIRAILKDNCAAIYHIGSTSVPGLAAKPVIDIMPVVYSLEKVDLVAEEFRQIGYEYMGEWGIPGRRYLRKGGDHRTHHVHIFAQSDTENIRCNLAFPHYLRTHESVKQEYARLKKELAAQHPYDIEAYCDGKDAFIKAVDAAAKEQAVSQADLENESPML